MSGSPAGSTPDHAERPRPGDDRFAGGVRKVTREVGDGAKA
jgi:hypothetical protein